MLESSGADYLALLVPHTQGSLGLKLQASENGILTFSEYVDPKAALPTQIAEYVKNTSEIIVFNDLETDLPLTDPYFNVCQPRSLLCLPLLNQSSLVGVLYLHNQEISNLFTGDRITVLNFLCSQAAIAIENARLFEERMTVEQSLRASQTYLKHIANNIPGIIYQFRQDGRGRPSLPYMSDRTYDLLEFSPQLLRKNAEILLSCIEPQDLEQFKALGFISRKRMEPFLWIGRFNLPSGKQKWIEAKSVPTLQPDGSCIWDGVMLDVSDRVAALQKLQQSQEQLRTINEQLEEKLNAK